MKTFQFVAQLQAPGEFRRSLDRIYQNEWEAWIDAEEIQDEGDIITVYRREAGGVWASKTAWASYSWTDLESEGARRMERVYDDLLANQAQFFFESLRRAA